jgi:hypothetical protein
MTNGIAENRTLTDRQTTGNVIPTTQEHPTQKRSGAAVTDAERETARENHPGAMGSVRKLPGHSYHQAYDRDKFALA